MVETYLPIWGVAVWHCHTSLNLGWSWGSLLIGGIHLGSFGTLMWPLPCPLIVELRVHCAPVLAYRAVSLGKGALLAKIDIKSAYRLILIVPQDRVFLGLRWKETIFVDGMLPFGLCSAPKVFSAVADASNGVSQKKGLKIYFITLMIAT